MCMQQADAASGMQSFLARISEIEARQSSCQSLLRLWPLQLLCIEYLEMASLRAKAWLAFWHRNIVKNRDVSDCMRYTRQHIYDF